MTDGTFGIPGGSPVRSKSIKFSYRQFTKEKKKLYLTIPKEHVVDNELVLSDLKKHVNKDYIALIGYANYLIKPSNATIITDLLK